MAIAQLVLVLDVIKYCDHPRWYKNTTRRWDLQSELGPPIRGETSNWRWDLQSEVTPSRLEVGPLKLQNGYPTSDQR